MPCPKSTQQTSILRLCVRRSKRAVRAGASRPPGEASQGQGYMRRSKSVFLSRRVVATHDCGAVPRLTSKLNSSVWQCVWLPAKGDKSSAPQWLLAAGYRRQRAGDLDYRLRVRPGEPESHYGPDGYEVVLKFRPRRCDHLDILTHDDEATVVMERVNYAFA